MVNPIPVNIFIFGDLVLDHFIPVTAKQGPSQPVGRERVFDGLQRRTIAGGAANCARVTAALSKGRTCLWGLSGYSPWGSFIEVLQRSLAADGSEGRIIVYGSHNESHQMNTVTRVVSTDPDGMRSREFRFDDIPLVPIADTQRRDALAYLRAESETHGVDAIIINDLNMEAIDRQLVNDIGAFAAAKRIPLFVDPKRDWSKYRRIQVTCVLPNLIEWCHIVEATNAERRWREDIVAGRALERLAIRSLRYMPNAEFHIIKCDKDGAVVIGPAAPGRRLIHHIGPPEIDAANLPGQLGAGDVLVAALAVEYARLKAEPNQSRRMLDALSAATGVVACYLQLDWQKVPNQRELKSFVWPGNRIAHEAEATNGVLLLPEHEALDLGEYSILGSALVSVNPLYIDTVNTLMRFLVDGWNTAQPLSAILTGRGGVGKSELLEILAAVLGEVKVHVWADLSWVPKDCPDVDSAIALIGAKLRELGREEVGRLLVVIDEAFSKAAHLLLHEKAKMLLQDSRVRFLFIDADYRRHRDEVSRSQVLSRCRTFELPALATRHSDIPFIFAATCLRALKERNPGMNSVRISETVLLSVINEVLRTDEKDQSPRLIVQRAKEAVAATFRDESLRVIPEIRSKHLPVELPRPLEEVEGSARLFLFSWARSTVANLDRSENAVS